MLRNRGQPIKEAIMAIFGQEGHISELEEQNKELIDKLILIVRKMDDDRNKLVRTIATLEQKTILSGQTIYRLEQNIKALEAGKLDKPFHRKKT